MKKINLLKRIFKCTGLITCLIFATDKINAQQQTKPVYYWTFEGTNPLKDSMNNSTLDPAYYKGSYSIDPATPNSVGNSLKLDTSSKTIVGAANFALTTNVTIEFLFKPGADFNTSTFIHRRDNAFTIKFGYPFIQFNTITSGGADNFQVNLQGVGRATYGYYTDGNYHHMVFKYNAATGVKQIWVDGQLPVGFSDTTAAGTFAAGTNAVDINANTSYVKYFGNIDEIALYDQDLPANNIYKHYTDFLQHKHYSFPNSAVPPPAPAPVTSSVDINEFAAGHPNYTVNAVTQLQNFPMPRYKKGHTLMPNFNWLGLKGLSGEGQPGMTTALKVSNSVAIQKELVKNFNYYLTVSTNSGSGWGTYNDPTTLTGAWVQLANQNPQWRTQAITFWPQLNPKSAGFTSTMGYIENKNMPDNHYLRNSSGQFINNQGALTSNHKTICPSAPLDSLRLDGLTQRYYLSKLVAALTRPLNIINENNEVIPHISQSVLQMDPAVVADKATSGIPDWLNYVANRKKRMSTYYRDQFMSLPGLQNTIYSEYQIGGNASYMRYNETRTINTPINGQIYATPDFYPRWPSNWRYQSSAWNGWQSIADGRVNELAQGDKLFSPFVAAGWNSDEERNIRPAQWLGLLKVLGMAGAEFYYSGYFGNDSRYWAAGQTNPPSPAGYAYQAVMPSYAQAITSRYENLLRNGNLMNGDVPNNYSNPTKPGYSFETGDLRKLVIVRKHQSQNIYAVTGTIQPNSNMLGNTELESDAKIKLDGNTLQFDVRRQGSTYIYDNSTPSSPVFYQLDGWHESSHPSRWTKDFNIESELYENAATTFKIKTDRATGAAVRDFRNSTSYISLGSTGSASVDYYIQPRAAGNYYFWVRARSRNGVSATITVSLDSASKNISCITDTNWQWYSIDACSQQRIAYNNLSAVEHKLTLTATGAGIEIDRILMTVDGALNLNPNQAICSSSLATVNTSGATTFCQGGSVTLTANGTGSYQWSNGATTQAITVSTTGNYSVTIIGGTCNSSSTPIAVTVNAKPTATITANGSTTFCANDSVQLSASAASSYVWSNGATTQAINVSSSGNYLVTVTAANGCSKTSSAQSVSVSSLPVSNIIPAGPTSFCDGGSVTLTSLAASSYLWSTGETTQSVTAYTNDPYSVTVTNASGCTAASSTINITVFPSATASITASGTTQIIQGDSVVLTANNGASYLWSPNGETTQSIGVTQAGNYQVTVYNANACSATSVIESITVLNVLTATITVQGSTSLCDGDSSVLSAQSGMSSYAWSPNGETTQSIVAKQSDTYQVTITDSSGNTATSNVTISVNPRPGVPSIAISYIPNVAYQLTASEPSAASFLWSNGETTATITVTTPATYSVQAINNFACISDSAHMDITSIMGQQCAKPDMLTVNNITDTSAMVGWNPAITGDSFIITYWETSTTNYQTVTVNGNISSTIISGLQPGKDYDWNVATICLNSNQLSDNGHFATIVNALPCGSVPQNLSVSNIQPKQVNMKWYNTFATTFKVRFRPAGVSAFSYKVYDGVTHGTGGVLNALTPNTTYEWSVLTTCNGITTAYSPASYFTTLDTCGFMGILEVNSITSVSCMLMWDNTDPMDTVRIRVQNDSTGVRRNIYLSYNPSTGTYPVTNLKPNTTYTVDVRGKCSVVQQGSWSNKITFTTENITMRTEENNPLGLNGFPNPAANTLNYTFADDKSTDYNLKVCDMSGRELYQQVRYADAGPNAGEVDVRQYPTGLYMLIIQKGAQSSRFRFAVH